MQEGAKVIFELFQKVNNNNRPNNLFKNCELVLNTKDLSFCTNSKTQLLFKLPIEDWMMNISGNMHGGVMATIIDEYTTVAIMALDREKKDTVSVDLNINYIKGVSSSEDYVYVLCQVDKVGKNLCFSQCWLYNSSSQIVSMGRHTKARLPTSMISSL